MPTRLEKRSGIFADGTMDGRRFAALIGVPHGTVKRWLSESMPCVRDAHHVRIDPQKARKWIAERYPNSIAFRRAATIVYFVRRDSDGAVKIGFTSDIERRLREIRRDCRSGVTFLAGFPGTKPQELALHSRFAVDHLVDEWFHASEALLGFVAGLGRSAA